MGATKIDREGQRFKSFEIVSEGEPDERGRRRWNARFYCGLRKLIPDHRLNREKDIPKHCGALVCKANKGCRPKERTDGQRQHSDRG